MPSIFVWKSTTPNTSTKHLTYYAGSSWFLEDNGQIASSYMYTNQLQLMESHQKCVVYNATKMPQNWVGSELLEVSNVPYYCVKDDNYGTLECVGQWMRFISKMPHVFEKEALEKEFEKMSLWINSEKQKIHEQPTLNFNECLIKFSQPVPSKQLYSQTNKSYHKPHYKPRNHSHHTLHHNQNEFAIVFPV